MGEDLSPADRGHACHHRCLSRSGIWRAHGRRGTRRPQGDPARCVAPMPRIWDRATNAGCRPARPVRPAGGRAARPVSSSDDTGRTYRILLSKANRPGLLAPGVLPTPFPSDRCHGPGGHRNPQSRRCGRTDSPPGRTVTGVSLFRGQGGANRRAPPPVTHPVPNAPR